MHDLDNPYMLKEVLREKGFNDKQISLIIEALADDRVCPDCGGKEKCYCNSVYDI